MKIFFLLRQKIKKTPTNGQKGAQTLTKSLLFWVLRACFADTSIAWLRDSFGSRASLHRGLENSATCLAYIWINYHNNFHCFRVKVVLHSHLKNICGIYLILSRTKQIYLSFKCNSCRIKSAKTSRKSGIFNCSIFPVFSLKIGQQYFFRKPFVKLT